MKAYVHALFSTLHSNTSRFLSPSPYTYDADDNAPRCAVQQDDMPDVSHALMLCVSRGHHRL